MKDTVCRAGWLLLALVAFAQCTKDDPIRSYIIEQETREWAAFKPGSYWVYEDATGLRTDSTYVCSYSETVEEGHDDYGNQCRAQQLEVGFAHGAGTYTSTTKNILPRGNGIQLIGRNSAGKATVAIEQLMLLPFEFIEPSSSNLFEIVSINNQVEVAGEVVSSVIHVKCRVKGYSGAVAGATYYNEYWIAKNKWIVKLKVKNPATGSYETWQLRRYKIVQ